VVAQDVDAGRLTVAIRRKPDGQLTPWLLQSLQDGAARDIEVSIPGGPGLHSAGTRSVVFFAGGVGVTPAVAMANALSPSATMHLDYSVEHADDAAFLPKFDARCKDRSGFSYTLRQTSATGNITRKDVQALEERFRGSKFYICGPQGYVDAIHRALRKAKVDPSRIHVELFALSAAKAPARTFRFKAYVAGALLAFSPLMLLLPAAQEVRPHGHPNVGHERLQCVACHVESPASTRQTLQAKAKHAVGMRQTGAVLGMQPVTTATCIQCHANPDDRHAPNRFLEPRFEKARAETGAQACVSCHREHSATRLTVANTGYCASCHQDLKVKDDRTSPTHDHLVQTKQWGTCLQCHDYHGNHRFNAPLRLQDGATLEAGPSPYGSTVVKARQEKPQ
jgi:predicted CXXCH cytochrome family protein